ncbi:MAG: D-alanine--D-alanine ligase [Planctomycetes bacterium]|jgi:D-alanine-D-alanine ligase|nr:D-alanine--D-alanine ligase [Planctomycetota bacterium]
MLRIALLYGGTSSERDISIRSGEAVWAALERIGHRVTPVDYGHDDFSVLERDRPDFVFIALHGGEGEDGTVQRRLEALGLAYSGSGPVASRLAMDKELTKAEFLAHRVPTPPGEVAEEFEASYRLRRMARRLGWPLCVKPIDQGSSIGVSIVRGPQDVDAALAAAFAHGPRVLLERGIVGRELTVGVVGNRALPVCEVIAPGGFFDYQAKYNKQAGTRYVVNPDLPGAVAKMAQHYARRAHHALRCHGYSRVDLMLDGNNELWVLEVNTLPGMTETSLLPKSAAAEGVSFDELVQELIDVSREPRRPASNRHTQVLAA